MSAPLLPIIAKKGQRMSCLLLILLFSGNVIASEDNGTPALLIVPDFQRPAISRYLLGSKRTLLTLALISKSGDVTYLKADAFQTPTDWDHFLSEAKENSLLQLAMLNPTMIHDEHGVIQMAAITTESSLVASCILLPGFLDHFISIFGPEILIAIPTRNKICIFPKLANHLPQMINAIRDEYLVSPIPASTEIFELSRNGLHAVGSLNPDDE